MDMSPPVVPDAAQPVDAAPAPAMWILVETINDYRASRGLDPVRFSPSLQRVAEVHAQDLADHFAGFEPGCNLHSWSESADWTGCCYTSDHAQARCMWNKPRELTAYPGDGYEISSGGVFDAESALRSWQGSDAHHDVIINAPPWNIPWRAVGGAIRGRYAVVWFGHEVDPAR